MTRMLLTHRAALLAVEVGQVRSTQGQELREAFKVQELQLLQIILTIAERGF